MYRYVGRDLPGAKEIKRETESEEKMEQISPQKYWQHFTGGCIFYVVNDADMSVWPKRSDCVKTRQNQWSVVHSVIWMPVKKASKRKALLKVEVDSSTMNISFRKKYWQGCHF